MIDFSVGCDGPDDEISNLKRRILELERSEAASREELESSRKNLSDTLFRYENLIDKSRSIILEWDTDGTILFLNAWGQELFGYTERELVGRNVVGTIVPPTDDRGENLVEKMIRVERNPDEFYSSENVNIRKSGEQLWISWTNIGVRDRDGKIFKTLSIGIDRTIQHRQELTLLRHSEELESKVAERTRELSETICARTRELEEIRKMTEALQTSEERFRLSMEATHDGLWDWDIRTDRAYFSPGYYRMLGYRVDEFDANGTAWADMVHPDDRAKALRATEDCIAGRCDHFESEFRMRAKSGEWRWILGRGTCFSRDENGRALRLTGTHVDVTSRKNAEEILRESEKSALRTASQLRMVNEIGAIIANGLDLETVLLRVYEQCGKIGETSSFFVSLYDDATGLQHFLIAYRDGERMHYPPYDLRNKPGVGRYIIANRRGIYIPDLDKLPEGITRGALSKVALARSFLGVPLMLGDRVVGILSMQSFSPDMYSEDQLRTLELLGTQVAIAVRNSQLYEQVQRERNLVETVVDNLPGIFAMTDRRGGLIRWNGNAETLTGLSPEELKDRALVDLFDEKDRPLFADLLSNVAPGGCGNFEARLASPTSAHGIPVLVIAKWVKMGDDHFLVSLGIDMTMRRKAEEALRESEARYRNLYKASPDGIILIGTDGRIESANREQARMYRYDSPDGLIGIPATDLVAPSSRALSAQIMRRRLDGEEIPGIEYELVRKDGTLFRGETRAAILRSQEGKVSGYLCVTRDTTERTLMEEALRESEERFRSIFMQSPIGIELFDAGGSLVDANQACLDMFGVSDFSSVKGFRLLDDPNVPRYALEEIRKGGTVRYETPFDFDLVAERGLYPTVRRGGIDIDVQVTLLKIGGRVSGYLAHVQDITRQKKLGESIQRLNTDLEKRVRERTSELEAANQELDAFSYAVSHDLRSPLRALKGYSEALLSQGTGMSEEKSRHYIQRIQESARHMDGLVIDLLNLSQLTRKAPVCERTDLSRLASEIVAQIEGGGDGRRIEWKIEPGIQACCDPNLMKIALDNLLGNAWKYTSRKEVALIEFGAMENDGERVLFVRDNGAGFDMSYAGKLFTPFQRLHSPREFPGTGIGLTTVKRIVARHGGRIWAESEVDRGATFFFTIGNPA